MSDIMEGIHTMTNPKGTGWVNQANGVTASSHRNKTNAIAEGRQLARTHGAQLTIHAA